MARVKNPLQPPPHANHFAYQHKLRVEQRVEVYSSYVEGKYSMHIGFLQDPLKPRSWAIPVYLKRHYRTAE